MENLILIDCDNLTSVLNHFQLNKIVNNAKHKQGPGSVDKDPDTEVKEHILAHIPKNLKNIFSTLLLLNYELEDYDTRLKREKFRYLLELYNGSKTDINYRVEYIKFCEENFNEFSEKELNLIMKSSEYNKFVFDPYKKEFAIGAKGSDIVLNQDYFRNESEYSILDCSEFANFCDKYLLLCKNSKQEYVWFYDRDKYYNINWENIPMENSRVGKLKSLMSFFESESNIES